jgi:hypothetical protein
MHEQRLMDFYGFRVFHEGRCSELIRGSAKCANRGSAQCNQNIRACAIQHPPLLLLLLLLFCLADVRAVDCVATCEADLTGIWQGVSGNILSKEFRLAPSADTAVAYPSGCTGVLKITLIAVSALANLKQQFCDP